MNGLLMPNNVSIMNKNGQNITFDHHHQSKRMKMPAKQVSFLSATRKFYAKHNRQPPQKLRFIKKYQIVICYLVPFIYHFACIRSRWLIVLHYLTDFKLLAKIHFDFTVSFGVNKWMGNLRFVDAIYIVLRLNDIWFY